MAAATEDTFAKIKFEYANSMLNRVQLNEQKLFQARNSAVKLENLPSKAKAKETFALQKKIGRLEQDIARDVAFLLQFKERLQLFVTQFVALLEFEQGMMLAGPTTNSAAQLVKNQAIIQHVYEWMQNFESKTQSAVFSSRYIPDQYRISMQHTRRKVREHVQNRSGKPEKVVTKRTKSAVVEDYDGLGN